MNRATRTDRLVVIGASAGGIEALREVVRSLPARFPAPLVVVVHVPAAARSVLPSILARAGRLPASAAQDRQLLEPGTILVAPPDRHVIVEERQVRVTRGPQENRHRPAVDPLFRSAASSWGDRAIGVILSGTLDDGTDGLAAIRAAGGWTIAQDPGTAQFAGMPSSAIDAGAVDEVLPLDRIGSRLAELVAQPPHPRRSRPPRPAATAVRVEEPA